MKGAKMKKTFLLNVFLQLELFKCIIEITRLLNFLVLCILLAAIVGELSRTIIFSSQS